jgi:hypothetical protein
MPIPLDGIEVEVHTTNGHSVTTQVICLNDNVDKELHDKPHELV